VGLLVRGISASQGRYLHTEQHKQNKLTETSVPRVGFDPTIPVFQRAKTVTGSLKVLQLRKQFYFQFGSIKRFATALPPLLTLSEGDGCEPVQV
jgi:hypothetical protein